MTDEATRTGGGSDLSPAAVRRACEASLRRLGTDRIDVYLIHPGDVTPAVAADVVAVFEELVAGGQGAGLRLERVRTRRWSTSWWRAGTPSRSRAS